MKSLMPQIDSNDGLFHNGNPATGEQGTRVTDTWLNDVQDRVRDVQAEAHYVLLKAGFRPVENKQTQLYEAIVKIIDDNRKFASTTQKGEVRLTSDTGLDSEELGLTARAGKKLAQMIAVVQLALNNYIPLNKRSSSVNSNDENNVATSKAVKTAYDKGVEAKTAADNAQRTANDGVSKANAANQNAEGRVSKLGDSLTGILHTVGIASTHFGLGAYSSQYTSGAPFLVESTGSKDRDNYHPFVKGLVRSKGRYGAGFSFGYTTKQGAGDGFGRGIINLVEDNGTIKNWGFEHNGDFNSAGDVRSSGGKSLNNAAQLSDFVYQKIGNFEVRKYPDGTMLQTYIHHPNNGKIGVQFSKQTFNWAVAFVEKPKVFIQHVNKEPSENSGVDITYTIQDNETTNSKVTFWVWEWYFNNLLTDFNVLAIGRWK